MEGKILNYSISLIFTLLISFPLGAQNRNTSSPENQSPQANKARKAEQTGSPFYRGLSVSADLWGMGSKVFGGDFLSTEVAVDVNLKNRFFPIAEIGYGTTDTWSEQGIHYKSSAPYFRIGMDYNTLYKKKHGNMLLVGLRYGATRFDYDIETPSISDPVYGGELDNPALQDDVWNQSVPFRYKGLKSSMQWAELNVGIRAHVWKAFYMGWALRFKFKLSASVDKHGDPWYVPGFGKYGSNTLGVTYTIIYKLPL